MKEKIIEVQKKWANGIIKMGELSDDKDSLEKFTNGVGSSSPLLKINMLLKALE